jgi:large subunit ribosomal protein L29
VSFPKVEAARALDDAALSDRIVAVKRELFELRMRKATRQEVKPHEFKHAKHELAQLLTVERERQLAAAAESATAELAAESAASTPVESSVPEQE